MNRQVVSKEAGERSFENGLASLQGDHHSHSFKRKVDRSRPGNMGKRNRPAFCQPQPLLQVSSSNPIPAVHFVERKIMKQLIVHKPRRKQLTKDAWKQVKDKKLCFNCLRPTNNFYNAGNCRQPSYTAEGCGKKHHRLLHQGTQTVTAKEQHQPQTEFSGFVKANQNVTQTLLQTAVAKMIVDQEIPVRVLLDPDSQRSYIRKQIAESVCLRGPTELLTVSTQGGETSQARRMHRVTISLLRSQVEDESAPIEMEALTIDKVCVNLDPVKVDVSKYDHLRGTTFADTYPRGPAEIDTLVGADHY